MTTQNNESGQPDDGSAPHPVPSPTRLPADLNSLQKVGYLLLTGFAFFWTSALVSFIPSGEPVEKEPAAIVQPVENNHLHEAASLKGAKAPADKPALTLSEPETSTPEKIVQSAPAAPLPVKAQGQSVKVDNLAGEIRVAPPRFGSGDKIDNPVTMPAPMRFGDDPTENTVLLAPMHFGLAPKRGAVKTSGEYSRYLSRGNDVQIDHYDADEQQLSDRTMFVFGSANNGHSHRIALAFNLNARHERSLEARITRNPDGSIARVTVWFFGANELVTGCRILTDHHEIVRILGQFRDFASVPVVRISRERASMTPRLLTRHGQTVAKSDVLDLLTVLCLVICSA